MAYRTNTPNYSIANLHPVASEQVSSCHIFSGPAVLSPCYFDGAVMFMSCFSAAPLHYVTGDLSEAIYL